MEKGDIPFREKDDCIHQEMGPDGQRKLSAEEPDEGVGQARAEKRDEVHTEAELKGVAETKQGRGDQEGCADAKCVRQGIGQQTAEHDFFQDGNDKSRDG